MSRNSHSHHRKLHYVKNSHMYTKHPPDMSLWMSCYYRNGINGISTRVDLRVTAIENSKALQYKCSAMTRTTKWQELYLKMFARNTDWTMSAWKWKMIGE